jgi:hypothetical protein
MGRKSRSVALGMTVWGCEGAILVGADGWVTSSAGQVEAVHQVGPAGIGEGVEGGEADAGHQLGVLFGVGLFRDRRMVRPSYDDNRCFYIMEVVGNPTTKE